MAPLKGKTLGEKHKNYNILLKEKIAQGNANLQKINYDADDIDNMINIDIACIENNVDYIMDVLRCDDMLYVKRAIRKSSWLITEMEYAHLINPDYLDLNVFPDMTTQGTAKLLLHIRLHLRDEKRAEDFFNYVAKNNPKMAVKWLEHCSFSFLKETVTKYATIMSSELLKRLCKKHSISILEMYVSGNFSSYFHLVSLQSVVFLLKSNTEKFLNITDTLSEWTFIRPTFNKKATQFLMKHCSQRVIENFQCYRTRIDIPTLITYLKRHDNGIESFILSKSVGTYYYELKPFLDHVPQGNMLELLRKKNGTLKAGDKTGNGRTEVEEFFYAFEINNHQFSNVYRWYEFAPHDIAFRDLQKFIYAESSPKERHSMLIVLLTNAGKNMDQVRKVLQYYHDKHINEPYIHKIEFVKSVLAQHDTFRFDDATWLILNKIFHSLEVYIQSKNKVQQCLVAIILRSVLNDVPVHEIVEQRFYFKTLVHMKNKLNENEQNKIFDYLHNYLATQLRFQDVDTELEIKQAVALISKIWKLLKDWKREKTHYQFLIESIIQIGYLNRQLSWNIDMKFLTSVVKQYCSKISENAFLLYPCEEVCIHALKYDFDLLVRNKAEVKELCRNSKVSLKTLFSKLRIYWRESLATEWRTEFINELQNGNDNEALVRGVFLLSSQEPLLDFIKKYSPSETDETATSMREFIAKSMHLARPQLPVEVVLSYARGDCLQHTLCSVHFIYYNIRPREFYIHINTLLTSSVPLQKQGIRQACDRMKKEELHDVLYSIWISSTNSSIRNKVFQFVFELLCKEDGNLVTETWNLLSFMIDSIEYQDDVKIYSTLYCLSRVPFSVIGEYYQKTYIMLRNRPKKSPYTLDDMLDRCISDGENFIQYLDCSFVENTILKSVYHIFASDTSNKQSILAYYLLCSKNEITQMRKYKNLFAPLFSTWQDDEFDSAILRSFQSFLTSIARALPKFVFEMNMVMPLKILTSIKNNLEYRFKNDKYAEIIKWKLFVGYIKVLDEIVVENPEERSWENVHNKSVDAYSKLCIEYLRDDIEHCYPSIYLLFANAMTQVSDMFRFDKKYLLNLLDGMLICEDLHIYMCVLKTLPNLYSFESEAQVKLDVIRRKLYRFPSKELKMYYFARYSNKYAIEDCI